MLFFSREWNWKAGGILHTLQADIYQKMGFTRIRMISSGFLSSTGIPFTSFNSSPTWISPSTHKHKCKFLQISLVFFFVCLVFYPKFDLDTVLGYGAKTHLTKYHIHVDWHGLYDWKISITNNFHSFRAGMNNRQDKMSNQSSRKHISRKQNLNMYMQIMIIFAIWK